MSYIQDADRSPVRRLISFGIPIFMTNFLQVFYALVDMAVVGRFVGQAGLAGVANGSIIAYLLGSIGTGLALGGAVAIGHYYGAGRTEDQRETVGCLLVLMGLAACITTPICLLYAEEAFQRLKVPAEALPEAAAYMSILAWGNICYFAAAALSFACRATGDSRRPLEFMLAGGLINIGLDLILVGPLAMGVRGAALATVAAQAAALVYAIIRLKTSGFVFDFRLAGFKLKADKVRLILRIGLPSLGRLWLVNCSYLLITVLLNGYGATVAAAAGVGLKICTLAVMPCWAVGQALTALAAIALGGGRPPEAEKLGWAALKLNLAVTALVVAAVQIGAGPLMALFNPDEPAVVHEGVRYLRICCSLGVLMYAAMYTFDSLVTGAGRASLAFFNSLLDSLVVRLGLIWLFSTFGWGLMAIYFGQALSALIPALAGAIYFRSGLWRSGGTATGRSGRAATGC